MKNVQNVYCHVWMYDITLKRDMQNCLKKGQNYKLENLMDIFLTVAVACVYLSTLYVS